MARSKDFIEGWSMGWTAATQSLLQSFNHFAIPEGGAVGAGLEVVRLEAAGNKPAGRRRGRPPKSASLLPAEPPRRKRGRPPKAR